MPEIAEVEIVRKGLLSLQGQRLLEIKAEDKYFLPEILLGQSLVDIKRHGKLLGFFFSDSIVAAHLRMTGKFLYKDEKHRRAHFRFERDDLFFIDPRGFATINFTEEWPGNLGPDIWKIRKVDLETKSRRAVKAVLLDQKVVAGIGNYLADESLYRARIHPQTKASSLKNRDWERIIFHARDLSKEVLARGGVSLRDYKNTDNEEGEGQELLQVYGRGGEECYRCLERLEKTRVAARGTVLCPACQVILPEQ
jgi:formamidopyrimidine-DNA glycosylase